MAPRIISERYELSTRIGSGGMGTVWRANDRVLERDVAVKLLHEGLSSDTAFAERFRREARSAASLSHPNIVAVYDTGEEDGIPFIVMELVEGESLHAIIARDGPMAAEDTARVARSILAGLGHAHSRGLVHRDMKPANVLCDAEAVKVVDFGIAKGLEDSGAGLTRTSGLIGTAAYLSPEQVSGHHATQASDLYAVGCLLFACLTGEPPFGGGTPVAIAMSHLNAPIPSLRARRPDVPPDFDAVIMRALAKDPAERFASAEEMERAIASTGLDRRKASAFQVLDAPTVVAAAPTVAAGHAGTEVLGRPAADPKGPGVLAAVTAFLVAAAIAALAVLYLQNRDRGTLEAPIGTTGPGVTLSPSPTQTPTQTPTGTGGGFDLPGIDLPGL